jgi:hypothetical protein
MLELPALRLLKGADEPANAEIVPESIELTHPKRPTSGLPGNVQECRKPVWLQRDEADRFAGGDGI